MYVTSEGHPPHSNPAQDNLKISVPLTPPPPPPLLSGIRGVGKIQNYEKTFFKILKIFANKFFATS